MSKSDHDKPRKSKAEKGTVARRARSFRRASNRLARNGGEGNPPMIKGMHSSMCHWGCCW